MLFVVLALLFSVLSKLSKSYTKTFSFKISAINVPEDNVVIYDSTNVMQITLSTYGFKHIKYYFVEPTITVDFANLKKNATHFNWVERRELSNVINQFDSNVTVENISPDSIAFRYDVYTVKMVPIVLKHEIAFASGFDVTEVYTLEPDSIKVIGPKILTDSISEIFTKELKLENINSDVNNTIGLKLPNENKDLQFSHKQTQISGAVERFTEGTIEVPVNVINVPNDIKINYYPKTVPVFYYTSLSNFKTISSSSFIVECDYNALNSHDTFLVPKIVQQPDLVKNTRLNVKRIEFIKTQ
jgi:hypothetical protein